MCVDVKKYSSDKFKPLVIKTTHDKHISDDMMGVACWVSLVGEFLAELKHSDSD